MGLKGDVLVCDYCGATITKVVNAPAEGWPNLRGICHDDFEKLRHAPAG